MKGKRISSLRYKQILILLLGACISFVMYLFVQTLGDYFISRRHMDKSSSLNRLDTYQDSFETYIRENRLSVKDVRAISKWVKNHKYVYVTIYDGDEILYESGFWNDSYSSYETAGTIVENGTQTVRNITFINGTFSVSIIDSSEIKWYNLVFHISLGVFCLVFFYHFDSLQPSDYRPNCPFIQRSIFD